MIALYGFSQIRMGLDHFYSDYLWFFASNGVISGTYDKYFTRPLNPLFQIIIETVQFDALGEIIAGFALYIYSLKVLNILFSYTILVKTIFFIVIACIIYTSIKIIGTTFAFFIKHSFTVLRAIYSVSNFAKYHINYILLESMKIKDFVYIILIIVILIVFTRIFWKEGEKSEKEVVKHISFNVKKR